MGMLRLPSFFFGRRGARRKPPGVVDVMVMCGFRFHRFPDSVEDTDVLSFCFFFMLSCLYLLLFPFLLTNGFGRSGSDSVGS